MNASGNAAPLISVAVSTHNREGTVANLVSALSRQTLPTDAFDVVIVDDGSTDDTVRTLAALAHESQLNLKVIRSETNRGPAAGRNLAWRACQGRFIAFTDDDCQPAPDWLERGLAAIEERHDVIVGRTIPNPDQEHQWGPFSRTMRVEDTRFLQTCNIFYPRADLEAVGGFDEGFPTPGGEDTDLGWRVERNLGRGISFAEDVLVHHDVRPSDFIDKVKTTWRWVGIAGLVAKHPKARRQHLHWRLFWQPTHPRVLLALAGLALARWQPIALTLTLPWVHFRTRRWRSHPRMVRNLAYLPGNFLIDTLEVVVMIRGSICYKTFVL